MTHIHGRLQIEGPQEWIGRGPVHSPIGRHEVTTKKQQTKTKSKTTKTTQNTATQNKTAKQRHDRCQFMGELMQEIITLYYLDMVWQQKQREEQQNHNAIPEGEWSNKSIMRKPGILPARIPEITWPCERCIKQRSDLARVSHAPHSLETCSVWLYQ